MGLANPDLFFASLKSGIMTPSLTQDEVDGCNVIIDAMKELTISWVAYALATAYHETASTMQPIQEHGGPSYFTRMYDVTGARPDTCKAYGNTQPGDGIKYCGRGYPQVTWKTNYQKASQVTGVDLVAHPERMLEPAIAAPVMRSAMVEGWFTGKAFKNYLPASGPATNGQFVKARYIINGTDCAAKIACHAIEFQDALKAGGYTP